MIFQTPRSGGVGPNDPDKHRKIFMGGLPNVDEEFLMEFFSKYGTVCQLFYYKFLIVKIA